MARVIRWHTLLSIAEHSSTKYNPFWMMCNIGPLTPIELTDNQRDGNIVQPSLSGKSMTMVQKWKTFTSLCLQKPIPLLRSCR